MNKKISLFVGVVLVLILILSMVLLLIPSGSDSVRIAYLPISAALPLFVALENNYFDDPVEIVKVQSTKQALDSIISGGVDVAIGISSVETISLLSRYPETLKIFTLSSLSKNSRFEGILVKKGSIIKTIKDLENKKIGVFPGLTARKFLNYYLELNSVDISRIKYIPLTPPNQIGALLSGRIDALFAYEPTKTIALGKKIAIEIQDSVFGEIQDPLFIGVSVFAKNFWSEEYKSAKKIQEAIDKSINWIDKNPIRSKIILAKYTPLSEALALKSPYLTEMKLVKKSDVKQFSRFIDLVQQLNLSGAVDSNAVVVI